MFTSHELGLLKTTEQMWKTEERVKKTQRYTRKGMLWYEEASEGNISLMSVLDPLLVPVQHENQEAAGPEYGP